MANRNIAFTIQLNGTEQVFNSIAELESAIAQATQGLKTFTGSEEDFKRLQDEIKKANNELTKINEGTRGLSTQKQIGEFLKFGQVVSGAFGAATTALSLFGRENEDVTQAAAKAQQILTLQYSIVTLAKEKDTIATAFNTAGKIANTIATQGLVAATRLLFTLIKANPFGAFLTILTAVVSAMVLFTDETNDANAAEENFQKTLAKGQTARQRQIQLLQAQGATEVEIAKAAQKAAEDRFMMAQFYYFNTAKDAEMFAKVEEEYDAAKFERQIAQINLETAYANQREKNAEKLADDEEAKKRRQEAERARIFGLIELSIERLKAEQELANISSKIIETEIESLDVLEKRIAILSQFAGGVEKLTTVEEDLAEVTKQSITETDTFGNIFSEVSTKVSDLFKQVRIGTKTTEQATKELEAYKQQVLQSFRINIPAAFYDEIKAKANEYREAVKAGTMTVEDQRIKLAEFRKESLKKFGVPFDEDKLEQLSQFTKIYESFFDGIEDSIGINRLESFVDNFGKDFNSFGQLLEQTIVDVALARGITDFNPFLGRTPEQIAKAKLEAESVLKQARELFVEDFAIKQKQTKDFADFRKLSDDQQNQINAKNRAIAEAQFDRLVEKGFELVKIQNDVRKGTTEIEKLNKELTEASAAARIGILQKNRKIILANYAAETDGIIATREKLEAVEQEINLKRFDAEQKYAGDIDILNKVLGDKVVGYAELSYRDKLIFLKDYLEQEVTATEDAEKKKQDAQQKTIDKILQQIQLFQAGLQAIQQAVSDYYNFQFDQLEKRNKRIQDTIVGDSERANELRLEADKAYTAERERLEKQQAKIALRLTLAQTIANVAQAVAQSLQFPLLAGVIAAAGAAQIGIVTAQINSIDAYKRGGRLRMAEGGKVTGAPHEEGGVKFQNGGVELEGNEVVINRLSSLRYADILSSINVAGGGKPIVMSNFDDSRIVEAIAKQRQMPLRAYVVESDITNAQTINKRLELLSQI